MSAESEHAIEFSYFRGATTMPIDSLLTLDRRSFIVAPLAAAVAATTGDAEAATGGTVYTGDVINGKKVVSALDINDLEPGRKQ
jgi:hypothetical protein